MHNRYFDNTRISTFKDCNRKYYLRHVKHWRKEGTAKALAFGLSWHTAMDIIWAGANKRQHTDSQLRDMAFTAFLQTWMEQGFPHLRDITFEEEKTLRQHHPGIALEMLDAYITQRRDFIATSEVLSIERPFAVPLDPSDPTLFYIGRLDKVFRRNGKVYVGEHKTTSLYAKAGGFRDEFQDSFNPDSQIDGYLHACHMIYGECAGVHIDAALVHKTIHDKFKWIPIAKQTPMLDSWLHQVKNTIKRIEHEKFIHKTTRGGGFLKTYDQNTKQCYNKYGKCGFIDICRFVANPAERDEPPGGFIEEKWEPFDILKIDQLGLSNE